MCAYDYHYYIGDPYLSGSAACHWYFNPDVPEAQVYYGRYLHTLYDTRCL
jgi:hypothetical protein